MSTSIKSMVLPVAAILWLGTPAVCLAQEALTLDEVLILARERNPRLLAAQQVSEAAAAREPAASTLPDPMFQLGIMNVALPEFSANMPMSMAPSLQLMQPVPFPGKLSLSGKIAALGTGMSVAGAEEVWWEVRTQAAGAFYGLYSLDRRLEVMRETRALLRDFETIAQALYAAGTGRQADVLRASVEVVRMDGEIARMESMRTAIAAALNALLDQAADTPLPSPRLGTLPREVPDPDTLLTWAEETRPALQRGRLGVDQAEARVELSRKEIWPNFTVGVQYGQRDRGAGTERMGSAVLGFTLPVFAGRRQIPARREAAALRRMAEAELEGIHAQVDARIGQLLAELAQARTLIDLYRDDILPQARVTVESALSSYRVGAVDFLTLVDAQLSLNRFEGELYQLYGDYGKGITGLEGAVGRALPLTDQILAGPQ
jgi:outer membrane protein TolC